jgi:hypothetical protein
MTGRGTHGQIRTAGLLMLRFSQAGLLMLRFSRVGLLMLRFSQTGHERSFDRVHLNADSIHQVMMSRRRMRLQRVF